MYVVHVVVAEHLKMVDRLHVVLLSIVPTGAALVYLLWMYGWKKPKGISGHHCQKPQVVEVTDADQSHDKVDTSVTSCDEKLLVSVNEQDSPVENDVCGGISLSYDVSVSLESRYADLKSPQAEESLPTTAVTYKPKSEVAVDIGDHVTADKANKCQSVNGVNAIVSEETDEKELLKYPANDSQVNSAVTSLEDDTCCNGCIADRNVDDDKVISESGCVRNNVTSEGCENGRRDSVGSVRTFCH